MQNICSQRLQRYINTRGFLFDLRTKLTSVLHFNGDNASLKMLAQVVFQQWRK